MNLSVNPTAVVLTHPERVVYPTEGITKGQIFEYYRAVAPWILPEISGRPLSLVRCPAGAESRCFFQKHPAGAFGEAVHTLPVEQKSGLEDYVYVDDEAGLLELVQKNVIELHPWGARASDLEHPDRLIFDLDPGEGVAWERVVAAARLLRDLLRDVGLVSFVRFSGGKGLHVVVPFAVGPSWSEAKNFAEALARALAQGRSGEFVATSSKKERAGKIFVDWLRNDRGATSVASWSLRAREGAPVAVPLPWEELRRTQGPGQFSLPDAEQRARRLERNPWEGIESLEQALPRD